MKWGTWMLDRILGQKFRQHFVVFWVGVSLFKETGSLLFIEARNTDGPMGLSAWTLNGQDLVCDMGEGGIWCMVCGEWYMVDGRWYMVDGIWYMVKGKRSIAFAHRSNLWDRLNDRRKNGIMGVCSRYPIHMVRYMVYGIWYMVLEIWTYIGIWYMVYGVI